MPVQRLEPVPGLGWSSLELQQLWTDFCEPHHELQCQWCALSSDMVPVVPWQTAKVPVKYLSACRDSSVGRAADWKSACHRFKSCSRHFLHHQLPRPSLIAEVGFLHFSALLLVCPTSCIPLQDEIFHTRPLAVTASNFFSIFSWIKPHLFH